ncbi:hypothetical protein JCM6882_005808 [Rhodosporidiobolus microsporus]
MRLFGGPGRPSLIQQPDKGKTNERSSAPITFLPLDVLQDILLDALPAAVSPSGRVKDDALQLVRRTRRLATLRRVCRAWRNLLERPFFAEVAVDGIKDLAAFALFAKQQQSDEAKNLEKLLVVGQPSTTNVDETTKTALKTLLKVCTGLRVLCLVEVDVEISALSQKNNLQSLFLHDCLIGDDLSYRRILPPLVTSNRPKLSSLVHLTVDGCLFVYRSDKYLRESLPPRLVGSARHNVVHNLNFQSPLAFDFPSGTPILSPTLDEYLACLRTPPVPTRTSLALSLSKYVLSSSISESASNLRASPVRTLYLDFNNPVEGHVVWDQPHPDILIGAKAVRTQPGSHDALGLVKELTALFELDSEAAATAGQEKRIFPELKRVVLPYNWGSEAAFEEYFDLAELPYHLAKLKGLVEARGIEWEVETVEQASCWGKARFAWVKE